LDSVILALDEVEQLKSRLSAALSQEQMKIELEFTAADVRKTIRYHHEQIRKYCGGHTMLSPSPFPDEPNDYRRL
jgi:hypothetical protein